MRDGTERLTHAQLRRRRQSDIDFLAWVRRAPLDMLLRAHAEQRVLWRRIAIDRSISRHIDAGRVPTSKG